MLSRRHFLQTLGVGAGVLPLARWAQAAPSSSASWFKISLAQWSLHRAFRGGQLDPMNFAAIARRDYGLSAIEYVNQFYSRNATAATFNELRKIAENEGVKSLLIMCDGEGRLGDPDKAKRAQAVDNHLKWLEGARTLGCHAIRVNAASEGSYNAQLRLAADGLLQLCEKADPFGLSVLVENHGGLSSNGAWLAAVMRRVKHPRVGTLPDFGNFRISPKEEYDRYRGIRELMPFARGVSAKSHDFDAQGNEIHTDYPRMLGIVRDAGYTGYIDIEYEGKILGEPEGIRATLALLQRLGGAV